MGEMWVLHRRDVTQHPLSIPLMIKCISPMKKPPQWAAFKFMYCAGEPRMTLQPGLCPSGHYWF